MEETILPLVLLGIRDVNDKVVAETLKALSILVEKVGSAKVIGGKKRKKIFVDGSPSKSLPNSNQNDTTNAINVMSRKRSQSNERQSPIGAETSDEEPATKLNFDQEYWEPWDDNQDDTIDVIDESVINQTSTNEVEVTSKPTITSLKADITQKEQDFFADMEPVIEPTNKLTLEDVQLHDKFAVHHEEGLWNDIDDEAWS